MKTAQTLVITGFSDVDKIVDKEYKFRLLPLKQ